MTGRGRGKALTRPAWMQGADIPPSLPPARPTPSPSADWSRAVTAEGTPYWYSRTTGTTTWTDPTRASAAPVATPAAPAAWKEVRTADGRLYYYNHTTNQTQWQKPPELAQTPAASAPAATGVSAPAASTPSAPPPTSAPKAAPATALPDGWAEHKTADGRVYYYHAVTRETSWNFPSASTQQPANGAAPSVSPSSNKRPAPSELASHEHPVSSAAHAPSAGDAQHWKEHKTPDGRVYYYNAVTRETSWTKPPSAGDAGGSDLKRPRTSVAPVADLRQIVSRSRSQKTQDKSLAKGHVVRRPRAPDGKALTDRESETYFIKRAQHRKEASLDAPAKTLTESKRVPHEEAEKHFEQMLNDHAMNAKSSWLEAMSRCAEDERYLQLPSYGFRKHAWLRFVQKSQKKARRQAIIATRQAGESFNELMGEVFAKEPYDIRSLDRCRKESVMKFEADPRFLAVEERTRTGLIKAFFATRARKAEAERAQRRKDGMRNMRMKLDEMTDPAILGKPKLPDRGSDTMDDGEQQPEATSPPNGVHARDRKVYFTDRTLKRDLERFLASLPDADYVADADRFVVIREWRREVEVLVEEKEAKEREQRKAKQRENRAAFRSGVEQMILDGKLPVNARWKEVAEEISKQAFAVPESELGARPVTLFEDGLGCFEGRVQECREDFKMVLKEADLEVTDATTVEDLRKVQKVADFLTDLNAAVVEALLLDRQKRESKRKQKEKHRALADFEALLRRLELPSDATFESGSDLWKDRTAFKQLHAIEGDEGIRRLFDEYVEWRKIKEQRRAKRKFDSHVYTPHIEPAVAPLERAKRTRVNKLQEMPFMNPQGEAENGWAAAVSAKPLTEAEKQEAREKRKRELLES